MRQLIDVIEGGYCIGCGACASTGSVTVVQDSFSQYQGQIEIGADAQALAAASQVCPFSDVGLNEDEIAQKVFDRTLGQYGEIIGYYQSLFAGHVVEPELRSKVTSGGIITWTLNQLLEQGYVDAVIHIKHSNEDGKMFEYGVSRSPEEVLAGAKSRYYPVEMSGVLDLVRDNAERYVLVGLPCFIKAARQLCEQDVVFGERIQYFVGLVCGHLKSKAFAEMMAWQAGVSPENLASIDFRHKIADRPAHSYGVRVTDRQGNNTVMAVADVFGTDWGQGFFKYEACDYCDDIFAETADLAVGDAWLDHYKDDSRGNCVVITRNEVIDRIVRDGLERGELNMDSLSEDEVRRSQSGGIRHRRAALGYRLHLKNREGLWVPKKRVSADRHAISFGRKLISNYRGHLRHRSIKVWRDCRVSSDFGRFERRMRWSSRGYELLVKGIGLRNQLVKRLR